MSSLLDFRALRASTQKVRQRCLNLPRHSTNRPVGWVLLPHAIQRTLASASVIAPSTVSQMMGGISDASSMTSKIHPPALWRPAKAAGESSDHVTASQRQLGARSGSEAL